MNESFSALNEFHFIRPHWLWMLIPFLLILALLPYLHKQHPGCHSLLALLFYQHLLTTAGIKKVCPPLF